MTFLSTLALAVTLLVVAPYLAHRLRRKRADEQPFPPARLVEPAPPEVRKRSQLEDRALLSVRAVAVCLLALLGATPLLRCSRLSLQRAGGASVAMVIVADDSMSMRAGASGKSRFQRVRTAAHELLASARDGDAVAIVAAGAPPRVTLAATTDLGAARDAVESMVPSDRATDLDGAVALASGLIASLPQIDRRIVVLSDLADGHPEAPPLGESCSVPLWVALPELSVDMADCAVMRADRRGAKVDVAVACGPGRSASGRDVVIEGPDGKQIGRVQAATGPSFEVTVLLPSDDANATIARLSGSDAVAEDDVAPIAREAGRGAIAVIAETADESVATGGAPIVEQALAALRLDVDLRPIPAFPDRVEDLAGHVGVLLDDPPGLTPEQRHAMSAFLEGGGVALVALGPRAAAAPLGATLEPVLARPLAWNETAQTGPEVASAAGVLAESAASLKELGAPRRASLMPEDVGALDPLLKWSDGAPLVGKKAIGRGEAWVVTLPFSVDASDLTLRPAFLALLDGWARTALQHAAPKRSEIGVVWRFPGARDVTVEGPAGPLAITREEAVLRVAPALIGAYRVVVDGKVEPRIVAPSARELDLRPRTAASTTRGQGLGERRSSVDVSGQVALALLAVVALEMALRVVSRGHVPAT